VQAVQPSVTYRQRLNRLYCTSLYKTSSTLLFHEKSVKRQSYCWHCLTGSVHLHVMPLGRSYFHENRHSDSHILLESVNYILTTFATFFDQFGKISTQKAFTKRTLNDSEFGAKRRRAIRTPLIGQIKLHGCRYRNTVWRLASKERRSKVECSGSSPLRGHLTFVNATMLFKNELRKETY